MSELIQYGNHANIRWKLLTGASVLVLAASWAGLAHAEDGDHSTVWIELGSQLERVDSQQEVFAPPFFANAPASVLAPMLDAQRAPRYTIGGEGKLTFTPEGSDWVFSAAVRYGRSNASRHKHHETNHPTVPLTISGNIVTAPYSHFNEFGDGQSKLASSHTILDFRVGKDVGLGMFGGGGTSVFNAGVRFAQFSSRMDVTLHARPVYGSLPTFGSPGVYNFHSRYLSNNTAVIQAWRNTHAIGPALSWDASLPVAGNPSRTSVTVDWGVNAAVLFGRQKATVHHQTSGAYFNGFLAGGYGSNAKVSSYVHGPYDHERSRSVTIPNIGGFAGVSVKFPNAKVSLGYRADFFFNALDTGLDTHKSATIGFYGPFASVSVGLGG